MKPKTNVDAQHEQQVAEEMGFVEKTTQKIKKAFHGKQDETAAEVKPDHLCVQEGCQEPKAPGQTHVCAKHIRVD